jgi:hypothetical protein
MIIISNLYLTLLLRRVGLIRLILHHESHLQLLTLAILTSCSSLRNQKESPLLRLPAELRNKIYGYALQRSTDYPSDRMQLRQ